MGFLVTFIDLLFTALWLSILGRVIMSWIDPSRGMRLSQILMEITEPILAPIRSVLPTIGMFDFSPIVALVLLRLIQNALMMVLLPGAM
jgi:YggT family protein